VRNWPKPKRGDEFRRGGLIIRATLALGLFPALFVTVKLRGQGEDSEVERHFIAARQAQDAGRLETAAQEYNAVLRLQPGIPEVYGNLGLVYYLARKFEDSAGAFEKALSLKPGLRGADLFLGIDYVKLYRSERAVPHLQKAVEQEPANKEARSWLSSALWDAGKTTTAIEQLRKAVNEFPGDVEFLFLLGQAYRKAADREAEQALADTSSNTVLERQRRSLERTYRNQCLSVLERLVAVAPDSFRVHQLKAQVYAYRDENDKALTEYRIVEQMHPELPGLHFAIGHLYWKARDNAHAIEELHKELQINPDHAEANAEAGAILVSEHEPDQATPYLEKALRLKPDLTMVHEQLGKTFYQRREFAKAIHELNQALAKDEEGDVHYVLGMVYKEMGRAADARSMFDESRKIKAERLARVNVEKAARVEP
jgi:tetratricopeptide (TPR) repeat protein